MSTSTEQLDNCGCCAPGFEPQPVHYNRAGLTQLKYRIGTHSDFLRRMMYLIPYVALPTGENIGSRPLLGLTTRSTDDPSIALLDAWAMSLDVLTFYQERIANEGFLRTATERRSLLELARSIGYELNPGVAASTYLAFTLDTAEGSPSSVIIPKGMRLMNIPEENKLPQKFETVEEIEARPEWNVLIARTRQTAPLRATSTYIDLKGSGTSLQPGDTLLVVGDERDASTASRRWIHIIVTSVKVNLKEKYTRVFWDRAYVEIWRELFNIAPGVVVLEEDMIPTNPRVYALRLRTAFFGYNAPDWKTLPQALRANYGNGSDWQNMKVTVDGEFDLPAEFPRVLTGSWLVVKGDVEHELRADGSGVKREAKLYRATKVSVNPRVDFTLSANVTHIVPDTTPPTIAPLPTLDDTPPGFDGTPQGNVVFNGEIKTPPAFLLRTVQVFAESEELELVESPATAPIVGRTIVLEGIVLGLTVGRKIVVSGKRPRLLFRSTQQFEVTDGTKISLGARDNVQLLQPIVEIEEKLEEIFGSRQQARVIELQMHLRRPGGIRGIVRGAPGLTGQIIWQPAEAKDLITSEVAEIASISNDNVHTTIILKSPLEQIYDRASFTVMANVAKATHGESIDEVLGGGDGSTANQRFKLRKPPLTYVPAVNAAGSQSTLEVRVNDVLWKEVPYLYGHQSREEVYIVRIDNDGTTSVIFGDGSNGARLPSGSENVAVHYRSGIGSAGEVPANSITVAQTRPLGVQRVTNPVPATGSAEPEQVEDARRNAPKTVLTFERVVSLRDFEDFSRAFAGIAKASAVILWNGSRQLVHVTVAGTNGQPPADHLRRNLAASIDALRDPTIEFTVSGFAAAQFDVQANVVIDPRYIKEKVLAAVKAMLIDAYSFNNRTFAQNVSASGVITAIQKVEGVIAVDLNHLAFTPESGGSAPLRLNDVLVSHDARWIKNMLEPAQLLLINPSGIDIKERP